MEGVNGSTALAKIINSNSTMAVLVHEWNVWETQTTVLLSFMLQLFLLATGNLRRRNTNGVLKALIWLGYVGADLVAVYALGLFAQFEDKYKLGRESFGDTLPLLWVPFLLVHLGGQDSITALSLEDNNLWLRHLLNLGTQGSLALYVFWKSFHMINYGILFPAMLVFVSGIIKYGERVWALKSASRNGLGKSVSFNSLGKNIIRNNVGSKESYALQTVLVARGLFVGRTVFQLGNPNRIKLVDNFRSYGQGEEKLKMVAMELGMMFDLLYTKANVLQRWTGVLFRCASQTLMVVAFFLFLRSEKGAHNQNRVNIAITYTLFCGAMFMEVCSVAMVIASPWTRAHFNQSSFIHGLSNFATSFSEAIHYCNKSMHQTSIGQFNYMDYVIAMNKFKPRILSKTISAIGLDKQWRNSCFVHDASNTSYWIIKCVSEVLVTLDFTHSPPSHHHHPHLAGFGFGQLHLMRLNFTLSLPFEHALYRLHLYTDLHLSRYFNCTSSVPPPPEIMTLKEECQTLSNYMIYLMVVHPSMLPVSTAAEDLEPGLVEWISRNHGDDGGATLKLQILDHYTSSRLCLDPDSGYPFEPEQINGTFHLGQSLIEIKAMWVRLLMYAAGKCSGDAHARQLGEGGELITFVWLLMMHHGLGDVARELRLFTSNDPNVDKHWSYVSSAGSHYETNQQEPLYAFNFHYQQAGVPGETNSEETTGAAGQDGTTAPGGATEQDEAAPTSGKAGRDDDAATPSEIDEQVEKTATNGRLATGTVSGSSIQNAR